MLSKPLRSILATTTLLVGMTSVIQLSGITTATGVTRVITATGTFSCVGSGHISFSPPLTSNGNSAHDELAGKFTYQCVADPNSNLSHYPYVLIGQSDVGLRFGTDNCISFFSGPQQTTSSFSILWSGIPSLSIRPSRMSVQLMTSSPGTGNTPPNYLWTGHITGSFPSGAANFQGWSVPTGLGQLMSECMSGSIGGVDIVVHQFTG